MEMKGIDVSYFQGEIDWQKVSQNQIEFAMVRATYGTTGTDIMFEKNMDKIKETDIYPGAYHYCYAMNIQEAVSEAEHFINTIKPYKLRYPAALDMEEMSIAELGKKTVTDIIIAFVKTLKSANYYPILYVDLNWIKNYIDMSRMKDLDIWLSEWGPQMEYKDNVTMWQYSSDGSVIGINDRVDMNISFKDYPSIIGNQEEGEDPSDDEGNDSDDSYTPLIYVVKKGDTLWAIADKFLGNGDRYREIMLLNNLKSDIITPGQILRIPQMQDNNDIVYYRVRRGDTLWDLALKFLGSGDEYRKIMDINGLTSDTIYPGQILKIPIDSEKVTVIYTVKKGDTLWDISKRFLGTGSRYKEIMLLNNLDSDAIYPGENLKIPSK